jgi:hypothetical protein
MLLDVYSLEFKAFSREYYINAIHFWKDKETEGTPIKGKILVNNKEVDLDYRIKDGDRIIHSTTREETPVYSEQPDVISET